MPAETIYGDSIDLYSFILGLPQDIFCLTVKGDSMIGALINEGDIALVQKNKEPRDGDIVAACVDGDCTLKFFRKDKKGVYLEAANDNYPIIRPKNSLTIEGVVINILRNYKK